jgi:hypothetical protein
METMGTPGPAIGFVQMIGFGSPDGSNGRAVAATILDEAGIDLYENQIEADSACAFGMLIMLAAACFNTKEVEVQKTDPDPDHPSWFGLSLHDTLAEYSVDESVAGDKAAGKANFS